MADGSQLSNQVYQAPQAPDYLGHYTEILRSIPDAGKKFQEARALDAQTATQLANYELMKQKSKAFLELYPAFKAAQIAKLQGEAATLPYKQALLQEQAGLAKSRAASLLPPPSGTDAPFSDFKLPPPPSGIVPGPAAIDPNRPPASTPGIQPLSGTPEGPLPDTAGPSLLDAAQGNVPSPF